MKILIAALSVACLVAPALGAEDTVPSFGSKFLLPPGIDHEPGKNSMSEDVPAWAQYKFFPQDLWERSLTYIGPDTGMKDPFWQYGPAYNPDASTLGAAPNTGSVPGFLDKES